VGFVVLTPVVVKSPVFSDMIRCSSLKVNYDLTEYIASIFRVEKYCSQERNMKLRCLLVLQLEFLPGYLQSQLRIIADISRHPR
jgi:hypothetical protein